MRVVTNRSSLITSTPRAGVAAAPAVDDGRRLAGPAALAGVVLFAASLALSTRTGLWLDEAQSLAIARLPVPDLLEALRTDGAPPLYYLLLHGWTSVFGAGDVAARSLSAVFAVGALALVPLAGARLGGRRMALASAAVFATTPFVHRYATEARMYTLVVLLTVAGYLAVSAALDRPTTRSLAAVGAVTGLLLLTHYWSFFLLATVAALLAVRARRPGAGATARRVLRAMALGSLLFLPWAPSFLYQLRHTGAPWGVPARGWAFEASLQALVGGRGRLGLLGFVVLGLAVLGLLGRPLMGGRVELDFGGRPVARPLAATVLGTLVLAIVASQLTGSAFATRYAAVVLFPFLLLVALGLTVVEHKAALTLLAAAVVGIGLIRSADEASAPRTQARHIAAAIDTRAQPGDFVAFCPDQLAPAVLRLVDLPVTAAAYPPGGPLTRVDWVDYRDRIRATSGREFARSLHEEAGDAAVWLAWAPGYHSLSGSCQAVMRGLRQYRPAGLRVQNQLTDHYERSWLWRFPPNPDD